MADRRAAGKREKPLPEALHPAALMIDCDDQRRAALGMDRRDQRAQLRGVDVIAREQDDAADERMRAAARAPRPARVADRRDRSSAARASCSRSPALSAASAAPSTPRESYAGTCRARRRRAARSRDRGPARRHLAQGCPDDRKYTATRCGASRAMVAQHRARTGPRRVEHHVADSPAQPRRSLRQRLGEVRGHGTARCRSHSAARYARSLDQARIALDADHARRAARQRQREVTQPAIQIEHPRARVQLQQLHGTRDQGLIHRRVDLDEVGRLELEFAARTAAAHSAAPRSAGASSQARARCRGRPAAGRGARRARARMPAVPAGPPRARCARAPAAPARRRCPRRRTSICGTRSRMLRLRDHARTAGPISASDRRREHLAACRVALT